MKEEFDREVEKKYYALSGQEKEYLFMKHKTTMFIVLIVISAIFLVGAIYLLTEIKTIGLVLGIILAIFLFGCIGFVWGFYFYFFYNKKSLLKNKDIVIKRMLKTQQKNEEIEYERQRSMSTFNGKKIKKVKIINSHTEYSDKLHAFLNYQEIKQHVIYKFMVYFEDGTTQIVNAEEGDSLYNKLISFLDIEENDTKLNGSSTYSSADEIRKYKQLLDDKIITQEEFEEKRKELLKK